MSIAVALSPTPRQALSPLSPQTQLMGSGQPLGKRQLGHAKRASLDKGAPLQFIEEFPCRYCGSTQLPPLQKGLDAKARRQLASVAVSQICSMQCPQHSMMVRVTDRGIAGIHSKKSLKVFFETAESIQYLLAGRKNAKKGNSTYVLIFAASKEQGSRNSAVHLVRFSQRDHVNELYKVVHRMMQDSLFAQLFDIHSEEQQRAFSPSQVLGEAKRADDNIQSLMVESMKQAMEKIESLRIVSEADALPPGEDENGAAAAAAPASR
mmetsp:Transcript_16190/g.47860  ORF Transcript_16190/g.47860 Transcript_16190/m.47860 type:complete len:265 (+) Transcript_16190:107-901(+)